MKLIKLKNFFPKTSLNVEVVFIHLYIQLSNNLMNTRLQLTLTTHIQLQYIYQHMKWFKIQNKNQYFCREKIVIKYLTQ